MASLYQLTDEYVAIRAAAEDGLDVSEALAQLEGEIERKVLSIVYVARSLEADAAACDAELDRIAKRRDNLRAQRERLEAHVLTTMKAHGVEQIKTPTITLRIKQNPPKVVILNEAAIPPEYMRTPEPPPPPKAAPDKAKILAAYKALGEVVPGTEVTRGEKLDIK